MAKKIYLSPSSQTGNVYSYGNTNEAAECRAIADLCVVALERCGFEAKTNKTGTMYDRCKESNAWGADAHIPIHTNAHNGKVAGFRAFYFQAGSEGHKLCSAIQETVAPITPGTSDGVSARPEFYEVNSSNAPCAYLELGFHDNPTEAQYIINHKKELAEAICKGICNHFGVKYIDSNVSPEPEQTEPVKTNDVKFTIEMRVLKYGCKGEDVKALQNLLISNGCSCGERGADGDFGADTERAVKEYQGKVGLTADGIAGSLTWGRLLGTA